MKINVCDVHYYENYNTNLAEKFVESTYRIGFKGGLKIDVCKDHQNYFKGCATNEIANKKYFDLQTKAYFNTPVEIVEG